MLGVGGTLVSSCSIGGVGGAGGEKSMDSSCTGGSGGIITVGSLLLQ